MTSLHAWYSARCICMLFIMIVQNFETKFFLRRGKCKTRENSNFLKKGKMVISDKIRNFSTSWMTTVGIVSQNLATTSNFVEFRDS